VLDLVWLTGRDLPMSADTVMHIWVTYAPLISPPWASFATRPPMQPTDSITEPSRSCTVGLVPGDMPANCRVDKRRPAARSVSETNRRAADLLNLVRAPRTRPALVRPTTGTTLRCGANATAPRATGWQTRSRILPGSWGPRTPSALGGALAGLSVVGNDSHSSCPGVRGPRKSVAA